MIPFAFITSLSPAINIVIQSKRRTVLFISCYAATSVLPIFALPLNGLQPFNSLSEMQL